MLNLVGSIDGENLAFGIARAGTEIRLDAVSHYKTSEFPTFTDAVQNYTREQNLRTSELQVGLAVAGVARGDIITQASCRWFISVSGLKAWLGCDPLIINDFSAIAWALSALPASRMKTAGPFPPKAVAPGGTYLVVGSGPGLGVATIVADKSGFITVLGSEGGIPAFLRNQRARTPCSWRFARSINMSRSNGFSPPPGCRASTPGWWSGTARSSHPGFNPLRSYRWREAIGAPSRQ